MVKKKINKVIKNECMHKGDIGELDVNGFLKIITRFFYVLEHMFQKYQFQSKTIDTVGKPVISLLRSNIDLVLVGHLGQNPKRNET